MDTLVAPSFPIFLNWFSVPRVPFIAKPSVRVFHQRWRKRVSKKTVVSVATVWPRLVNHHGPPILKHVDSIASNSFEWHPRKGTKGSHHPHNPKKTPQGSLEVVATTETKKRMFPFGWWFKNPYKMQKMGGETHKPTTIKHRWLTDSRWLEEVWFPHHSKFWSRWRCLKYLVIFSSKPQKQGSFRGHYMTPTQTMHY